MIVLNIVTVVKDDIYSLELTIKSTLNLALSIPQIYFIHHVQDGSSYDKTYFPKLRKVNKRNYKLIHLRAKDSGIFDAMNKASNQFKSGDLVIYMNAGDTFFEGINRNRFLCAIQNFRKRSETISFFRAKNHYKNIEYFMPPKYIRSTKKFISWAKYHTPVHQAVIFKCANLYKLSYPSSYKIQADSYLIYNILANFSKPIFYDIQISNFSLGGYSGNYKNFKKVSLQIYDQLRIMKLREQSLLFIFLTILLLIVKYIFHTLFGDSFIELHARVNKALKN